MAPSRTSSAWRRSGLHDRAERQDDFVYMGAGLVVGLLVGLLVARIGSIPLTLGSGAACLLLSGLVFGWFAPSARRSATCPAAPCKS